LNQVLSSLDKAVANADQTLQHIDGTILQGRRDLLQTIESLKEAVYYLSEFSRQVNDDPSSLLRSKQRD